MCYCCRCGCCRYRKRDADIRTTMITTLTVETTSSNTIFTIKTAIWTSSCRRTPIARPSSRIGRRKFPSWRTVWCSHWFWSGWWTILIEGEKTTLIEGVLISVFDTTNGFTVNVAIISVATICLKVINPCIEAFLFSDQQTFTPARYKAFHWSLDHGLKIRIRVAGIMYCASVGTITTVRNFKLVSKRTT